MHLHVTETIIGTPPQELAAASSLRYPSERPVYADVAEATEVAFSSALARWGALAAAQVGRALLEEINRGKHHTTEGAVAGWAAPDSGGWWCIRACECADGTLAQIFTDGRLH